MEIVVDMARAREVLDAAEVPEDDRMAYYNPFTYQRYLHAMKMERKELDRYERGMRRTAQYERMKFFSPFVVRRLRKWLKSPYAFRSGGMQ